MFPRIFRRSFTENRVADLEKKIAELTGKLAATEKKPGIWATIKAKGVPFAAWYFVVWAGGIVGWYGMIKAEIIPYQSVVKGAKFIGADRLYDLDNLDPKAGQIGMAVIANEIMEPARIPFVILTLSPMMDLVRRFRPPRL